MSEWEVMLNISREIDLTSTGGFPVMPRIPNPSARQGRTHQAAS